ncbi:translation initiation inhibitor [Candidatus Blochmanniella floridana]|uniref:Translation initiation inhibitor n=1 Tax=Blochmanniella floridana TaxID=203907 RepID=Q7VQT4_BLOFL|nr:translation initiation inhibitor [Candidatus Blochmannia floridanus]
MNNINIINKKKIHAPMGPYTQAIDTGNIIFISGQIPIIPDTGMIPNNIQEQTYQALENIKSIITSKNLIINNIVKTTLFIKNINDLPIINISYEKFFKINLTTINHISILPARSCVEVSKLPNNALIEIEAIAMRFNK